MFGITRGLTIPLLILCFATWAVFLGGLASLQNLCTDDTTNAQGVTPGGNSATGNTGALQSITGMNRNTGGLMNIFGFSAGPVPCTRIYRFYWFMVAFEILIILGALICAATKKGLHYSRPFWTGMFAIATLLFMIASEAFLAGLDSDYYSGGRNLMRMRTVAAGAIMTVVANILALFAIGSDWEGRSGKGMGHGEGMHGTTTTTAVPARLVATEPVGAARV